MLVKLKERGHRVLIFSQMTMLLDLLEEYITHKKWRQAFLSFVFFLKNLNALFL